MKARRGSMGDMLRFRRVMSCRAAAGALSHPCEVLCANPLKVDMSLSYTPYQYQHVIFLPSEQSLL